MHVYMHTYLLASAYIYINIYMYTAVKKKKKTSLCLITISSVYMSNKPNSIGAISSKQSDPHLTSPIWRPTDHLDR